MSAETEYSKQRAPMLRAFFKKIRLWYWKRQYRSGCVVSSFLAPDIRRDVEVIDASRVEDGVISARIRTWNVLYAIKGIAPEPPFGEVREIAIKDLWTWTGELWGGRVPD
jgi:hypothetical protein